MSDRAEPSARAIVPGFAARIGHAVLKPFREIAARLKAAQWLIVAAGSLVIVTTGVMRKWIGYVGLADGIAIFVAPLTVLEKHSESPLGIFYFLSLVVGTAWIVATGVSMARRREEPGATLDDEAVTAPAGLAT